VPLIRGRRDEAQCRDSAGVHPVSGGERSSPILGDLPKCQSTRPRKDPRSAWTARRGHRRRYGSCSDAEPVRARARVGAAKGTQPNWVQIVIHNVLRGCPSRAGGPLLSKRQTKSLCHDRTCHPCAQTNQGADQSDILTRVDPEDRHIGHIAAPRRSVGRSVAPSSLLSALI
jgi:hypothetical protein